jgi:hypothetical protein
MHRLMRREHPSRVNESYLFATQLERNCTSRSSGQSEMRMLEFCSMKQGFSSFVEEFA